TKGIGAAAESIKMLGLDATKLAEMSPDQQLNAISDAMANISSRSQQADIAAAIFGGTGTDVLNLLDMGSAGIAEMSEKADQLGLSLSRVDAAKIEQMNGSFDHAKDIISG